jgi:hypothetical protein
LIVVRSADVDTTHYANTTHTFINVIMIYNMHDLLERMLDLEAIEPWPANLSLKS